MGFHRKFENGTLIKHKVACGFTQVPGLDYQEAYLYAPVMHLKSFRISIAVYSTTIFVNSMSQQQSGGRVEGLYFLQGQLAPAHSQPNSWVLGMLLERDHSAWTIAISQEALVM
jgi:hypothetical protein